MLAVVGGFFALVVVALIVFAIVFLGLSGGAGDEQVETPTPGEERRGSQGPSSQPEGKVESEADQEEGGAENGSGGGGSESLGVGDAVEVRDVRVTLNAVRELPITDFDRPIESPDNRFVATDLTLENTSERPVSVSSVLEFTLKDGDGYSASQTIHTNQRQLAEGNLGPGQKTSGEIVYELPPSAEDLQLDYAPFAGFETHTWRIGDVEASPVSASGERSADEIQQFVSDYYAAVAAQDWATTYSYLDVATQAEFTEEEWFAVQERRETAQGLPTISYVTVNDYSVEETEYNVNITRTYEEGSQDNLDIVLYEEGGTLKRHLTREELDVLRSL